MIYELSEQYRVKNRTQHELKLNCKKILHRNGIWGLVAFVMYIVENASLKKSDSVAPVKKSQNLAFKIKILKRVFFQIINEKKL